jgi:hypothetical protein
MKFIICLPPNYSNTFIFQIITSFLFIISFTQSKEISNLKKLDLEGVIDTYENIKFQIQNLTSEIRGANTNFTLNDIHDWNERKNKIILPVNKLEFTENNKVSILILLK